jgi:serine protease Do
MAVATDFWELSLVPQSPMAKRLTSARMGIAAKRMMIHRADLETNRMESIVSPRYVFPNRGGESIIILMRRQANRAAALVLLLMGATVARAVEPSGAEDSPPTINLRRTVAVQVVEKTKNAVVNISTTKTMLDPYWRQFNQLVLVPANSLGSGFIIHKDGYVVTNNHVIDRARQITVELADGRKLPAELLNTDPDADLALLRIHADGPLPTLELGESDDLLIGEPVISVGNPFGFSHSVSTGIVSAVHRDIDPGQQDRSGQTLRAGNPALRDLIQTDAAINPGNSGGPLLNAYGQAIGINAAIRDNAQNIGFAIPIDRLRDLIPTLMNPAQVNKVEVPIKLVEKRMMVEPATVVSTVVSSGERPIELKSINGKHPENIIDAYAMLLEIKVNESFSVEWADGREERLKGEATPTPDAIVEAKRRFGISIEQVTPMTSESQHLSQENGLLITTVQRDSIASNASLAPADIIVRFGGLPVRSLEDFGAMMHRLPGTGKILIGVVRGNRLIYRVLEF